MGFLGGFNDLVANIREKERNPFFGTLIMVWILHHWGILYKYFGHVIFQLSVEKQIEYLYKNVFAPKVFFLTLFCSVLITIGVLIVSSVFTKIVTPFIVNFFEYKLQPAVLQWISPSKYMHMKHVKDLNDQIDELTSKLEKERKRAVNAERERDELIEEDIESGIVAGNDPSTVERMALISQANNTFEAIIKKGWKGDFSELIDHVRENVYYEKKDYSPLIKYLLKIDAMYVAASADYGTRFDFRELGQKIKQLFINEELIEGPPEKEG